MKILYTLVMAVFCGASLTACDGDEGPLEQSAEEVEEAGEEVEDAVD